MVNGGIFGPKLSGKTTLAVALSREYWRKCRIRSLVLDPHVDAWGEQAWVTSNESQFWRVVWATPGCLVIVEESAATIRRDRTLVPVFTRLRHCNHKLLVIGHSGTDLLPVMRQQLDEIYLFRQPLAAAKIWAEVFCNDGLLATVNLGQFEFIKLTAYGTPQKMKLTL